MNAQVAKTYEDGSVDILTLPVDAARVHVATRVAHPNDTGLSVVTVRIGRDAHRWELGRGWSSTSECDNAGVEHPGFPCAHPVAV